MLNNPQVNANNKAKENGTLKQVDKNTIERFGVQWNNFTKNEGYYGSTDCLSDIFGPLYFVGDLQGKKVCDIGSGTGRIVNMLLDAGALSVTAVEPSEAFQVLKVNTENRKNQVRLVNTTGDNIPQDEPLDFVISLGVLHHIVDPNPVVKSSFTALKPGGKMLIWLYSHEGNELYLAIFKPLRALTTLLPHKMLLGISRFLNLFCSLYIFLCKFLPMPMRRYFQNHYAKLDNEQRVMTVYDQLNPTHAKYYREREAFELLKKNGFKNVRLYFRHGYSWTVIGEKPE